ncbi:MAG: hypothetical protein RSF94_03405 [Rikenellaceae bacterium]
MKNLLLSALFVIAFSACSKSDETVITNNDENIPMEDRVSSISVSREIETKVGLDVDGLTFVWQAGDKVLMCEIADGGKFFSGKNVTFTYDKPNEDGTARFIGDLNNFMVEGRSYIACHKASGMVTGPVAGSDKLGYEIPATIQAGETNGYLSNMLFVSAPVVAAKNLNTFTLKHTMAVMKFILKNGKDASKTIKSVSMTSTKPSSFYQTLNISTNGTIQTNSTTTSKVEVAVSGLTISKEVAIYALVSARQATGVTLSAVMVDGSSQVFEATSVKAEREIRNGSLNNASIDCATTPSMSYPVGGIYPDPRSGLEPQGIVISATTKAGSTGRMIHKTDTNQNRNNCKDWASGLGAGWELASVADYNDMRSNIAAINNALSSIGGTPINNGNKSWYWAMSGGAIGIWYGMHDGSSGNGSIIPAYDARAVKAF